MDESTISPAGFSPKEMDSLMKYFVGSNCKYREQIIIPRTVGPIHIKSIDEKRVEAAFESCAFKSLVASVMGTRKAIQKTCISCYRNINDFIQVMVWELHWDCSVQV